MPEPHPWFQPLYRRVLTTAFCVAWLGYELWQQEPLWLLLVAAATGYAVWDFFLSGHYPLAAASEDKTAGTDSEDS